ncbi:MAG: nuclease domain-containing protein, partial [Bacteroidota bacterium]
LQLLREDPRYELADQGLVQIKHDGLRLRLLQGEASEIRFRQVESGQQISLWYNRSFAEGDTYTFTQTPDLFLEFHKQGYEQAFRYVIDAKYRFERGPASEVAQYGPPRDAIAQLHRYRDAILSQKTRKEGHQAALKTLGGVVLFPYPKPEADFRTHRFYQSYLEVGIGAIPLHPRPGAEHVLLRHFLDRLLDRPAEALYEEVIEYERTDQRQAIAEMEASVLVVPLKDDDHYVERLQYCLKEQAYWLPWQQGREGIAYLALYDERERAIIGYGTIKHYELQSQSQLQRQDFPWPLHLRKSVYVGYQWESWRPSFLPCPRLAAGGEMEVKFRALQLAIRDQRPAALQLGSYVWFRMWEEVYAIDPSCRLQRHESGTSVRFYYQDQLWTARYVEAGCFRLMQPSGKELVYDLRESLLRVLATFYLQS